ncbi:LysR family transcriptional regulator [Oribacterium sp. HCP28S3_H8]|jgi:DNA-binding transcriptional LysR family regulator|uniref:LysR family transcriptional regulator n=1 Tax=Oribacterium sp. HCP28S3_H8 TaxID=3438945 RepID=UPI0030737912|nr:LysR family transcriptional regulator [Oribacterium sp.]
MTLQQLKQVITVSDAGSMNEAAKRLFITQPSLSAAIKALEQELGIEIFTRSNRGIITTPEGEEFLSYARQVTEQYQLMEDKYLNKTTRKQKFSVSMQHYTFAVEAFIRLIREYGDSNTFEFSVHETKTMEVISNVQNQLSEVGIIYLNAFNEKVISKILRESSLEFVPLFDCNIYVFMAKSNPLAKKKLITMEDLQDYPCCSFEQGERNSFYFAEEVLSTYDYQKYIKVDDRATILNIMVGLNGYTLCSGIICQELNGNGYTAIPLDTKETMTIGYIKRKKIPLSMLGEKYVEILRTYEKQRL